jgi:hypothetical protein
MSFSGTFLRVALIRTDISEELRAFIIRVTRIGELGATLSGTKQTTQAAKKYCYPDDGGARFLLNVGSYKSHTT